MEVIYRNHGSSSLNPNAPMFVPMAYRTVEDFSDQWWDLVQSTPWFRDYWLQECFQDPQSDNFFPDDLFSGQEIFEEDLHKVVVDDEVENRALVRIGTSKWRRGRNAAETPRYFEKVPKIVNVKVSPRPIQQPR